MDSGSCQGPQHTWSSVSMRMFSSRKPSLLTSRYFRQLASLMHPADAQGNLCFLSTSKCRWCRLERHCIQNCRRVCFHVP